MYKGGRKNGKSKIQSRLENIEGKYRQSIGAHRVSADLDENIVLLDDIFKNCSDFTKRGIKLPGSGVRCLVAYIDNLINEDTINNSLLKSLMSAESKDAAGEDLTGEDLFLWLKESLVYIDEAGKAGDMNTAVEKIVTGCSVLFVDGVDTVLFFNMREWKGRTVSTGNIERVVMGPQDAFVEDISLNLSLLRNRLRTPDLKTEKLRIGRLSATPVVITYISGVVNDGIVNELRSRLERIDIDVIPDSTYIDRLIVDDPISPFPQIISTERPDRIMANLAEGRIAIFVGGASDVLIAPVTLADFLAAAEDNYNLYYYATFFRVLRYFAFIFALTGPAFYIAITTFHQEMVPLPLLVTIARSRAEMPFPAIVEAMFMEFTFEFLREAGIRLPQPVGPAISIVGGLVIGQGVVQAGIVSQTIVIVVALTGIASFSIPAFKFAVAVRVLRFPIMLLAAFLGIYGIIMGLLVLLIHLAGIRSLGVDYVAPFAPFSSKDIKDTFIRTPIWSMITRPSFLHSRNRIRMRSGMMPGPEKQK